jgi:hypothetical protein
VRPHASEPRTRALPVAGDEREGIARAGERGQR